MAKTTDSIIAPSAHTPSLSTTRRNFVRAVPAIAAAAAVSVPAFASSGTDTAIVAAWERRKAAYLAYNSSPLWDGDGPDPAEGPFWAVVDAAEEVIRSSRARTPRGAEIQLWVALHHCEAYKRDLDTAIIMADLPMVTAHEPGLDWYTRIVFAAIRSLQSMEV